MKSSNLSLITKVSLLMVFTFAFPSMVKASGLDLGSAGDRCPGTSAPAATASLSHAIPDELSCKEHQCLRAARWIGALSGSTMGLAQMYWSATGMSGVHGPFWKNAVTGIPSAVVGASVGVRSTEWMTRRMMKGNPKPGEAILKGAAYGAVDGAIILTASLVPLLIIGHYTGTIHFNFSNDMIVLKLLGAAALGGTLYGGITGGTIGAVYGPCISAYMEF